MQVKARRRRARREPKQGEGLIVPALRRLKLLKEVEEQRVVRAFTLACGEQLRQRVRGERYSNGVLHVRVETSSWANQVSFMKADLLEKTREISGGAGVRELRFTIGPVSELPDWQEPPKETKPVQPIPIDPRVAAALTQVPDDDLRDALGALYVYACRAGKR